MRQLRISECNGASGSAGHIHVRGGNSQPRQKGRLDDDDDDEASPPLDDDGDDDTVSAFVAVLISSFDKTSSSSFDYYFDDVYDIQASVEILPLPRAEAPKSQE